VVVPLIRHTAELMKPWIFETATEVVRPGAQGLLF
jgi:hypothetical protein